MTYTSLSFFILVAVSVFLYYLFPRKIRWIVLLCASTCFWCVLCEGSIIRAAIFLSTIIISYFGGRIIYDQRDYRNGKLLLILFIVCSAAPLLLSKGGGFVWGSILHRTLPKWYLPVGLSFYTLQIVAYLVDIYRGEAEPQKNVLKYSLFASFFPQLIQGPIPRYSDLQPQLIEGHAFNSSSIMRGIQLIIWGFFLKYMIADKAAVFVNQVFGAPENHAGGTILVAGILYSIQLYSDFLACVTISQGVAGLFGIRIRDNFMHPYFSTSIKDFWRRWHISLSSWLRDYIYIPLGGNKNGKLRKYLNLIITFAVSGLWHGASWKYLAWGMLHAGYQIIGELSEPARDWAYGKLGIGAESAVRRMIKRLVTFVLVMLAWIIFRADGLMVGVGMVLDIFRSFHPWIFFNGTLLWCGLDGKDWIVLICAVIVLFHVSREQERMELRSWFNSRSRLVRWMIYIAAIAFIWIFGTYGFGFDARDFIYGGF